MAFFQVLYWQDIPSQLKVWDDAEELRIELPPEFMARIDQAAQSKGLTSTDDYLAHWNWSEEQERDGSAQEVAVALKRELESKLRG